MSTKVMLFLTQDDPSVCWGVGEKELLLRVVIHILLLLSSSSRPFLPLRLSYDASVASCLVPPPPPLDADVLLDDHRPNPKHLERQTHLRLKDGHSLRDLQRCAVTQQKGSVRGSCAGDHLIQHGQEAHLWAVRGWLRYVSHCDFIYERSTPVSMQ